MGMYSIPKLIFFHEFPVKVGDAYYIRVRIVFEFLWYFYRLIDLWSVGMEIRSIIGWRLRCVSKKETGFNNI